MFGYLTATRALEKEDKSKYRRYYCGLCHELKEKYGKDGTINLSYDMTFLSLLLGDLYDAPITTGEERCIVRPISEHSYETTKYTEYAADMQMILSYYSMLDDVKDENKNQSKERKLRSYMPALEEKYPRQTSTLKKALQALDEAEKTHPDMPEHLAATFGVSFGEIITPDENDFFAPCLRALGTSLGRFIYLMDASDDRKEDRKKNLFNPLLDETEERIHDMLFSAARDAADAFEKLPLDDHITILRNIIYSGIWQTREIKEKEKGEEK